MKWQQWNSNCWSARARPFGGQQGFALGFCISRYGDGLFRVAIARRLNPETTEVRTWTHSEAFMTLEEAQEAAECIARERCDDRGSLPSVQRGDLVMKPTDRPTAAQRRILLRAGFNPSILSLGDSAEVECVQNGWLKAAAPHYGAPMLELTPAGREALAQERGSDK